MGLSGLLAGGALMSLVAFFSGLFATVAPMWLIVRTELHNKLCWTGEGLWAWDYTWGQHIPEMGLTCESTPHLTSTSYCNAVAASPFSQQFRDDMCQATTLAKIASIFALLAGLVTMLLMWFTFIGSKQVTRFARRIASTPPPLQPLANGSSAAARQLHQDSDTASDLSADNGATERTFEAEFRLALGAAVAALVACMSQSLAFFRMYTSPMFTDAHAYDISKHNPVPFNSSEFGCVFQSPLASPKDLAKSSPLKCLFGGPSFAMAATSMVSWGSAVLFFAMMAHSLRRLQHFERDPRVASVKHVRHPLLSALLFPRTYSLHGAISRHFEHVPDWRRRVIVMALPLLTMATAVNFAVMMLTNGAAVQVFVRISSPLLGEPGARESVLQGLGFAHKAVRLVHDEDTQALHSIEIIEEVFDFTMLTSISNFWDGKAYALAVLTAVFCAVWPYLRVAMHLLLYFVPVSEADRGRTLTWIDALGKWTLVNHFILCFMGVAFHLTALIQIPGLIPGRTKDLVDVGVEVILAPRFATYLFVIGVLVSIVVSEFYVYAHRKCKEWEETRRFAEAAARRQVALSGGGIVDALFQEIDTPYLERMAGRPTPPNSVVVPPLLEEPLMAQRAAATAASFPQQRSVHYQHGYGYEALCDRHHTPLPGKKYVYTPLAKIMVWLLIGFTATTTLAGMLQVSLAFTFKGLVGDGLVDVHDRYRPYSMLSIGTSIDTDMGGVPRGTALLTAVFFIFALIGPVLRVFGLAVLWFVPFRPSSQRLWFHLMEIIDTWSALDVYFVSTLAATLEIGNLSESILGGSFPGMEVLVERALPQYGGLFVVKESLLNGMWLMLAGVMCEKLLSQFIVAQTAIAVAERSAEEELALARSPGALPSVREEHDLAHELEAFPETMAALSPAARYTSASGLHQHVYSGLPRAVWAFGIRVGLMVAVDPLAEAERSQRAYFELGP